MVSEQRLEMAKYFISLTIHGIVNHGEIKREVPMS